VKTVLIPKDNEKDLADIPENVKSGLEIIPVATVDEVLSRALSLPLKPVEWSEEDELAETRRAEGGGEDREGARPH
jgi:ATP-dependent Lon protease